MGQSGHIRDGEAHVRHLRQSLLFAGLDEDALRVVAGEARLRRIKDGAYFFHQGEPATVLYVLTEGRVKFTQVTPEGHGVLLRVIGPPPRKLPGSVPLSVGGARLLAT